jgi:hypothetical protein
MEGFLLMNRLPDQTVRLSSFCARFKFSSIAIAVCGLGICVLSMLAGCGNEQAELDGGHSVVTGTQSTPVPKKTQTTTVTPSKTEVATSPAVADEKPTADSTPAEVCQRFMELLQSGNRIAAENLLTRTALTATSKAGLVLEPMGGPASRVEMGATRYATIKNDLAQVVCEVVDQVDGDEQRVEVTWLVRKQNMGWRISGLLIELDPGQPKNLLSFENINDVEELKSMAANQVLTELNSEAETRQANAENNAVEATKERL